MLRAAEVYDRAELVNLSSGREYTIREVVEALVTITGFEGEIAWDLSKAEGQSIACSIQAKPNTISDFARGLRCRMG